MIFLNRCPYQTVQSFYFYFFAVALTPCNVLLKGSLKAPIAPGLIPGCGMIEVLNSNQGPEYWMMGFVSSIITKGVDMTCNGMTVEKHKAFALLACYHVCISWKLCYFCQSVKLFADHRLHTSLLRLIILLTTSGSFIQLASFQFSLRFKKIATQRRTRWT